MRPATFVCVYFSCIFFVSALVHDWNKWKISNGKTYSTIEEERRHLAVWTQNKQFVEEHNARTDVTFTLALNEFADLEKTNLRKQVFILEAYTEISNNLAFVPVAWDWRTKGAVSPVKNPGLFADSQAYVATDCVESLTFIQTGKMESGSASEVHDCCTKTPAVYPDVFQCIHNIGGLCSEAEYPKSVGTCKNDTCSAEQHVNGGMQVPRGDETAMLEAFYKTPVMAMLDASDITFQLYQGGIYSQPNCSTSHLDHALLVVGYGSESGQEFWICKNDWGPSWGEKGYIRVARNKGNMCGIASMTTYPV